MRVKVILNGTKVNPYLRLGFTRNPFPQIGRAEYSAADRALSVLASDPIPNVEYIRKTLEKAGATEQFINLCCERFKPGERVQFFIEFPS